MKTGLLYTLDLFFLFIISSDSRECSDKLLDDRNKVPDSAFNESSFKGNFKGKWARESTNSEMAWCPQNEIYKYRSEYLIIDLGDIYVLNMIMTKGLSKHGFTIASAYIIEYKREEKSKWLSYRDRGVEKMIQGNKDHLTEKYESLEPSIIARWIKIYPHSETAVRVCLVLQIYGCKYTSNIIEYKMVDGSLKDKLNDFNYDGESIDFSLRGGLGKLVSINENKIDDPFIDTKHLIGWYQPDIKSDTVDIIFRFSSVQNFTYVKIETSNFFKKNVRIYKKIAIMFSRDGKVFDKEQKINIVVNEDNQTPDFRYIITDMKHNIGQFVKISLTFRSDWIIIRRIEFKSSSTVDLAYRKDKTEEIQSVTRKPISSFGENDFFSIPLAYTLVIIISILIILLLIGIPCVTIFIRRQKARNKKCKEALQRHYQDEHAWFLGQQQFKDSVNHTALFTVTNINTPYPGVNNRMMQESSIYTSLAGSDTESNCPSEKQIYMTQNLNIVNTCPIINPVSSNKSGLPNDYSAASFMTLGATSAVYAPYCAQNAQLTRSQVNLRSNYDMVSTLSSSQTELFPNDVHFQRSLPMYSPVKADIQGPVGNSKFYSVSPQPESCTITSLNQLTTKYPQINVEMDSFKYKKTLGKGSFGSMHVADLVISDQKKTSINHEDKYNSLKKSLTSGIETETETEVIPTQEKLTACIKVLSKDSPEHIRKQFYLEIKRLSNLNHKNCVELIKLEESSVGACVVISEYTPMDDVYTYLQTFSISDPKSSGEHQCESMSKVISPSNLFFIALQTASAMKHLESLYLVHRDLACRNILVMNDDLLIKITDTAICQPKFSSDYVSFSDIAGKGIHKSVSSLMQLQSTLNHTCQNGFGNSTTILSHSAILPIRWMSWESLLKGTYSTKSDIYAFGVTLWELLTVCKRQPYHELTNEQILINSNLQAVGDDRARTLTLPSNFSKEINDLISHCINFDEKQRPSFGEIDMFLQHKCCQSTRITN